MEDTTPKSNIIFFPTKHRRNEVEEEREFAALNDSDDAITISNYLMDVMQSAIDDLDTDYELNIDMADTADPSYKDFSIILNLLVAILFRRANMVHVLQDDLDDLYEKVEFLNSFPFENITTEKLFEDFLNQLDDDYTTED